MRIPKKALAIIIVLAFAAILGYLFTTYSELQANHRDLDNRLTVAQNRIPGLVSEKESLEGQQGSARSALASSQAKFPTAVESIEYGEDLFRVAFGEDLCTMATVLKLELTTLTAGRPTPRTDGGISYYVAAFGISIRAIEGDPDEQVRNILRYIDAIATGIHYRPAWSFQEPWAVDIKDVSITIDGETASATISIDIYGHRR